MGTDAVVGTTQRFRIPNGFMAGHMAAYFVNERDDTREIFQVEYGVVDASGTELKNGSAD